MLDCTSFTISVGLQNEKLFWQYVCQINVGTLHCASDAEISFVGAEMVNKNLVSGRGKAILQILQSVVSR